MTEESPYQKWITENPNYYKDYYEINKERLKEYQKNYKMVNAKKIKSYQKKYMRAWWENKKNTELQNKIDNFIATLEPIEMLFEEIEEPVVEPVVDLVYKQDVEEIIEEPVVEKIEIFPVKKMNENEWKPFYMR